VTRAPSTPPANDLVPAWKVSLRWIRAQNAAAEAAGLFDRRPRTFGDCEPGPCPWVGCRYHLYLDVDPDTGRLTLNFPDLEVDALEETCSLRAAQRFHERGRLPPASMREVGRMVNLPWRGVSSITRSGLAKTGAA